MRSANRLSAALAGLATLPIGVLLTGCVTTQQIAARARLVDARIRASQSPLEITTVNPSVRVGRLSLIRGRAGTALVAEFLNLSRRPLTDVPIAVGVTTSSGRKLYFDRAPNSDYFDSHVAAIGRRSDVTWVFTAPGRAARGRPFAQAGISELPEPGIASLPQIAVKRVPGASASGARALRVSVSNLSAVPQYGLQVSAVAVRGGRVLAAGRATLGHLGTRATATIRLTLLGTVRKATIHLSALPTIFQ